LPDEAGWDVTSLRMILGELMSHQLAKYSWVLDVVG